MCNLDAGLVARLSQLISCPQIVNLIIQLCNNANNKNRYESENINEKRGVKNGNATILAFEKKRKSSVKKKKVRPLINRHHVKSSSPYQSSPAYAQSYPQSHAPPLSLYQKTQPSSSHYSSNFHSHSNSHSHSVETR